MKKKITKRKLANAMRAAARFFQQNPNNWTRGHWELETDTVGTCYCAVGRVNFELGLDAGAQAEDRGCLLPFVNQTQSLMSFNDTRSNETGRVEVIAALRKLAAALDHGLPLKHFGQ